ncbi:MAG: hypothetical protein ACRD33_05040, partial [Candidatus Acidiferrales bacterium]
MDGEREAVTLHPATSSPVTHGRDLVVAEAAVQIRGDTDIVGARQKGRMLAATLGFSSSELTLIATAISELARNIVQYAKQGEIILRLLERGGQRGIMVR